MQCTSDKQIKSSKMVTTWKIPNDFKKCEWKFGQFVVRVLRDDEKEDAMNLIKKNLITFRSHPIVSAQGFDETSMFSLINLMYVHLDQNITLGCFLKEKYQNVKRSIESKLKKEDNIWPIFQMKQGQKPSTSKMEGEGGIKPVLVAVDALYVRNIQDKMPESTEDFGQAFVNWMKYTKKIEHEVWSLGKEKICNILTSFGVFVSAAYKDSRIPKEMFKIRIKLARKLWIQVTGGAFIGIEEQQAAEDSNYEIIQDFASENSEQLGLDNSSTSDLETIFPIIVMGVNTPCTKKRSLGDARHANKRQKTDNSMVQRKRTINDYFQAAKNNKKLSK